MNIFVLDKDPFKAAQMQCDKHIVKMILETAQLLCSIFPENTAPYKRTHYNHPCSKWTRESYGNYAWLIHHGLALCDEYTYRYNKQHKCRDIILWCHYYGRIEYFNSLELTPFSKCMPEECKNDDIVDSYRNYYITNKKSIAKWTKREIPVWWK